MKDNADLKAHSARAHVNPGLEKGINKLITQYFCTCVIPFVMLKRTVRVGGWCSGRVEGIKVCCGAIKGEMDFCRGFHCPIVYMHLFACVCVHVCMCQHPFLMSVSLCVSLCVSSCGGRGILNSPYFES